MKSIKIWYGEEEVEVSFVSLTAVRAAAVYYIFFIISLFFYRKKEIKKYGEEEEGVLCKLNRSAAPCCILEPAT